MLQPEDHLRLAEEYRAAADRLREQARHCRAKRERASIISAADSYAVLADKLEYKARAAMQAGAPRAQSAEQPAGAAP